LVGLTVAIYSCSKDDAVHQNEKKPFMTERNLEINRLIVTFKDKMADIRKNPTAKNRETVAADSALWYLEATINYSHGFPNEYYQEFTTDSLSLTIEKNSDGNVNLTELTQKYDELKNDVAAVYHASDYEDKGLTVIDLSKTSETDSEITISVRSTIGKINPNPDTLYSNSPPFGPLDNWEYGEDGGYCNSNLGDNDASERLTEKIQTLLPTKGGANFFYIEQDLITLTGGALNMLISNGTEPDNHIDYYLYHSINGTSIPFDSSMLCISYQDMNAYYYHLKYLIEDYIPNVVIPSGNYPSHSITTCVISDAYKWAGNYESVWYYHIGYFQVGEKVYTNVEPTEIQ
jgi:hypothetical protein